MIREQRDLKCQTDQAAALKKHQFSFDDKQKGRKKVQSPGQRIHAGFASRPACCAVAVSVPGLGSEAL